MGWPGDIQAGQKEEAFCGEDGEFIEVHYNEGGPGCPERWWMSRPWMHSRTGGTELRASRSGRDHGHHSERLSQGEAAAILTLSSSHKPAFLLGITAAGSTRCCTHCAETTSIYLHALCHHSQPGADTRGGPFPTPSSSAGAFFQKSSRGNPLDHLPPCFISPRVGGHSGLDPSRLRVTRACGAGASEAGCEHKAGLAQRGRTALF